MASWLGIDFSGDVRMWGPGCTRSNVWIAEVRDSKDSLALHDVQRVQSLPGDGLPFQRLIELLRAGAYKAAAVDAPFSVPLGHVAQGDHPTLLARASELDREGRPFPKASVFLRSVWPDAGPRGAKIYRGTEELWRGLNVRSTTWAGPRGGAAMTAACLTLLAAAERPLWPWAACCGSGLLAEAFPAAQLKQWGLPHQQYNGDTRAARENRKVIVEGWPERRGLTERLDLRAHASLLLGSADALDAVLCAFAAIAVTRGLLAHPHRRDNLAEGWIAVHA